MLMKSRCLSLIIHGGFSFFCSGSRRDTVSAGAIKHPTLQGFEIYFDQVLRLDLLSWPALHFHITTFAASIVCVQFLKC